MDFLKSKGLVMCNLESLLFQERIVCGEELHGSRGAAVKCNTLFWTIPAQTEEEGSG